MSLNDQAGLNRAVAVLEESTAEPSVDPMDVLSAAWLVYSQQCLAMAGSSGAASERKRHLAHLQRMETLTRDSEPNPAFVTLQRQDDWLTAVKHVRRLLDESEY
jgi:hypothetical protein